MRKPILHPFHSLQEVQLSNTASSNKQLTRNRSHPFHSLPVQLSKLDEKTQTKMRKQMKFSHRFLLSKTEQLSSKEIVTKQKKTNINS